ncbi:MAG: FtsX-like permease family protein [Anaeromyxobacter sp.]
MRRYLLRALLKELRSARALFALAVAGVALGVAAVLSIQLLDAGAVGAFSGTVRAVSGDVDVTVLGWSGGLDEALLPEVLGTPGVAGAMPLWRADAALEGTDGGTLELVGVDLLAPSKRPWALQQGALEGALGTPGWVAVTQALAAERGWRVGDPVDVSLGARRVRLWVGALVDLQRVAPLASRRLAVMDLAQAQGLLGVRGRIHQLDVTAREGVAAGDLAARLQERLGDRARVTTPEARTVEASGLLAAFRLNLTALSLVSLLVGGFLVYASVRASLARRREELGVLRAVGATRAQVLRLVLAEAALLGALGTAAGIPLGWLAARANLGAVSSTLRNVYLLEGIDRVTLTPGLLALAVATGVLGALAGALWPALDASRQDPRALLSPLALDERGGAGARRPLLAGLAALALGAAVHAALAARWSGSGFALALGLLAAAPLAAPAGLRALTRTGRPRRLGLRHGLRTAGARLAGVAPAAGALAVAVAMLVGVTLMVGSFRETVVRWLDATLHADVYVTSPSWRRARSEATLGPEVLEALARVPGTVAVDRLRQHQEQAGGRRVSVSGIDAALPGGERRVALLDGDGRAAMAALRAGGALVSEPLARKAGLGPGGTLRLHTLAGERPFPVAGVYRDYGSEGGAVLLDLGTYARAFGPGQPSSAALYLAPGRDPAAAVAAVRAALPGAALQVRSNATLRREVLAIFEETFAVTRLLRSMGLAIAAAGVTLALLVLARERRAELALLRALGASRAQLFRVFLGRGLAVGWVGLALGGAAGAGLAWVLVSAINPASFGWTLGLYVPWTALLGEAAVILAAVTLASLYPALAASRTPAAELSRDAL